MAVKLYQLVLAALAAGLILGAGTAALAGYTESSPKYFTTNGQDYFNKSDVLTGNTSVTPSSLHTARTQNGVTKPYGYIGVLPRIYTAPYVNGPKELCAAASDYNYNSSGTSGLGRAVYKNCGGLQYYAGQGRTKTLKADGTYSGHDSFVTPTEYQS